MDALTPLVLAALALFAWAYITYFAVRRGVRDGLEDHRELHRELQRGGGTSQAGAEAPGQHPNR
ncbi:hypothetical protein [Actinotalea sp. C106]|uniref:hypothetical protein n=1 Tax=Actinotalea sp. C106 TaxID=2908644 RepID=UPI002028FDBE|nr:hypothetical protein [Actinotalea sp. C106]